MKVKINIDYHIFEQRMLGSASLGPVVNILAIFSNANILNKKNYNMCYML